MEKLLAPVLSLPRLTKRAIVIAIDVSLCFVAVWLAFFLRLGEFVPLSVEPWKAAIVSPLLAIPIFWAFGLYREVFRYLNIETLGTIVFAVTIYGIIYASIFTTYVVEGTPRTIGIIQPLLLLILIASARSFGRFLLGGHFRKMRRRANRRTVLIYGAGASGRQLAAALRDAPAMRVAAFLDDNANLSGSLVGGVRVWKPDRLADLVDKYQVEEVLLALPSVDRRRRNEILALIRPTGVAVRTLPGLMDLAHGNVTVNDIRPLEVDDLLGRETVPPQIDLIERNIRDQVVLVTGAGGSIGSELCRQILACDPTRLLLVESSEFALYNIHRELTKIEGSEKVEIVPLLGSVCDEARMNQIFNAWRPETIFHAAAYKHVPLVEHNLVEGVRNNVIGSWVCAKMARDYGASLFVLVSTDKAVRPTNVMGASKRLAEMVLQALAAESSKTIMSMVRFGNVLGSSGSVVPLFRTQIAAGGPISVTHREVTRYFMTIPEAAQLVLQAGAMAEGGDVFVLDMGEPVKIHDLAVRMIELSGLSPRTEADPDGDIEIEFTGLRPGEKLYEELLIGADPVATSHPRVMRASEKFLLMGELAPLLAQLRSAIETHDIVTVRRLLVSLVSDYEPDAIVDNVLVQEARAESQTLSSKRIPSLPVARSERGKKLERLKSPDKPLPLRSSRLAERPSQS